jgi:hypothetical protein
MYKGQLKISVAEAHVMCETIKKLRLQRPGWFDLLSYEELASCYNGAGSDKTPKSVRKVLTRLLGFAREAVLIHDAEYQYSKEFDPLDYTDPKMFSAANSRLGENAKFLAKERTPWYAPLRYWRMLVARDARIVTNLFGYDAWVE